MQFYCVDSAGHKVILVKLRADGCKTVGDAQSVCLSIPVEAGAIDSFVTTSALACAAIGAKAYLQMADRAPGSISLLVL